MKKILFLIIFFMFSSTFAADEQQEFDCSYGDKIIECLENQDSPRAIEDFLCIQASPEKVAYQIILDEKFEKLDEEMEDYLTALEESKNYYFGPEKKENYVKAIDDIEKYLGRYGYFETKYKELCKDTGEGSIINEALKCFEDRTSVEKSHEFLRGGDCEKVYRTKISVHRNVAQDILKLNKQQVSKDSHKTFSQQIRREFDNLLDIIRVNIGYVERIWMKWPTKTKNAH